MYIRNSVAQCWGDQSTIVQVVRSGADPNQRPSVLGKRTRALKFGLSELLEGGRATRIMQVYSDSKRRSVLLCCNARRMRAAWKLKI